MINQAITANTQSDTHRGVPSSFRDPAGSLLAINGRILRIVNRSGVSDLKAFLATGTARRFLTQGNLVDSTIIEPEILEDLFHRELLNRAMVSEDSIVVEHERIQIQNFPYEWSPEMLHSAATLTLDLADSLLQEGMGLKDATPYNILFRGPRPVFIDLLSFERRDPADPIWLPQGQFERTFLLPLLVNKLYQIPLDQTLVARRDGMEPEEVYRLCGPLRRFSPKVLSLVSIPVWLSRKRNQDDQRIYRRTTLASAEKAQFILRSNLNRLRRILTGLEPEKNRASVWSDYESNNNYSSDHFSAKSRFVEQALSELKPRRVLDVGCNTGHFSAIAARSGATVVAIDSDPTVVGATCRKSLRENLDILALAVNLSRPSPAIGWRNSECPAFLERARGHFDAVMMLAVIHHMLVSERIPLKEILDLAAELTTNGLIIEFISPEDSMFQRLTRGRDHLFVDLNTEEFERECRRKFHIIRSQHLEGTGRWLYLLRKN